MAESNLMREIQLAITKEGHRLFRNNVGAIEDKSGKYVRFGLCEGSSDLIGIAKGGRFLAVEVKSPGARTAPKRLAVQTAFLAMINQMGGIGIFATSPESAVEGIKERL